MPRAWIPTPNITDQLGTAQEPWEKLYVKAIYDGNGNVVRLIPTGQGYLGFDAGDVVQGLLDPRRIDRLTPETLVVDPANWPNGPSLGTIRNNAALGALSPILRINQGYGPPGPGTLGLLTGLAIAAGTLKPSALNPNEPLAQRLIITDGGSFESDDYFPSNAGYKIKKGAVEFNEGVFGGHFVGAINIGGFFIVLIDGSTRWMNPTKPSSGMGIDTDGNVFFGSDTYADAQTQIDNAGNISVADNQDSKNLIQAGAVEAFVDSASPSQAGGQFQGVGPANSLKLVPMTRGSTIWFTLASGVDPADPTNAFKKINYSAVGLTIYDPAVGIDIDTSTGDKVVKFVCEKFGVCSPISKLAFTNAAGAPSAPVFNPHPDIYINPTGTLDVSILSDSSIKFTNWKKNTADPGAPSDTNGTAYSGPIHLTRGTWTIRAFSKNGTGSSAVVTGVFTVKVGSTASTGPGTDNTGGTVGGGGGAPGHSGV